MIIPSSNSYKILNSLPNNIKILASSNVNTLCALSMFTEILKKQSVQYEIQIVNDRVKIIDKQYTVCIDTHQDISFGMYFGARELLEKKSITVIDCTLTKEKSLLSVMSMYDIARNINFITERIMWPINVCLSQALQINEQRYEEKENDENGTRKNTHKSFAELEQMIAVDTQKINTIRMENKFYIPYLRTSTLFNSLITIKSKHKTYEMLAYLGISINEANQPFESTTSHTKETINDVSSTEVICKVSDVDRITPIENYYNMIYYLSQEKCTDALLSLEKICYKGKRIYECIKTIEHTKMKKVNGLNIIFVKKRINLKNKYLLLNLGYEAVKSKCDALIYTCEESIVVTDKKMNELNIWKGCYKVEKNNGRKCIEYLAYLN